MAGALERPGVFGRNQQAGLANFLQMPLNHGILLARAQTTLTFGTWLRNLSL